MLLAFVLLVLSFVALLLGRAPAGGWMCFIASMVLASAALLVTVVEAIVFFGGY